MKKRLFSSLLTAVVGAVAFTSCTSEVLDDVNSPAKGAKQKMTFAAQFEDNVGSRTSLSDNKVLWSENDAISVFDGVENNPFVLTSGAGTQNANFTGEASSSSGDYFIALYPYQPDVTLAANLSDLSGAKIPEVQIATKGSSDPNASLMVSWSDAEGVFEFLNVCSYAKITTTMPCKKITFNAGKYGTIAGEINISKHGRWGLSNVAYVVSGKMSNEISLVPADGAETFEAGTYYIALMPSEMGSMTVQCVGEETIIERSLNQYTAAFRWRGVIVDLGTASIENGWSEYDPYNGHEYVDLGLPSGLKWATMNVGATTPEGYGDYFAWGETTAKTTDVCDWTNYTLCDGTADNMYKYNASNEITVLKAEDDAASVNWGGEWRMPTIEEYRELLDNTDWSVATQNGVMGRVLTSKVEGYKDKSIFLPYAGKYGTTGFENVNNCCYWTSSLNIWNNKTTASFFLSDLRMASTTLYMERCIGLSVRPVCE